MNISGSEIPYDIIAKTCCCKESNKKVTYSFANSYHILCKDKKEIIISEIKACERLRNCTSDNIERNIIAQEIEKLKMTLELLT